MTIDQAAARDDRSQSPDEDQRLNPAAGRQSAVAPGSSASERRSQTIAFSDAVVALAAASISIDEELSLKDRAAEALVCLSALDASEILAEALRPDPEHAVVTWTVACYQIGDLVPCALRDYTDPGVAVAALAARAEAGHVAAELIASTDTGLRWSALVRAGKRVSFQPFSADSATCASTAQSDALSKAFEHWGARLIKWSDPGAAAALGQGSALDFPQELSEGQAREALRQLLDSAQTMRAGMLEHSTSLADLASRLSRIERALARLELALESAAPLAELVEDRPSAARASDTLEAPTRPALGSGEALA